MTVFTYLVRYCKELRVQPINRIFLLILLILVGGEISVIVQVQYNSYNVSTPPPSAVYLSVPYSVCSDLLQTVAENAYVRGGNGFDSIVSIGGAASETGFCDVFLNGYYLRTETRYMSALLYYQQPPGLLESQFGSTGATYAKQDIDTAVGPSGGYKYGSGPVNNSLGTEGDWSFRVRSRNLVTSCSETPSDSADVYRNLTVTRCGPRWNHVTAHYFDIVHLAPGTVYIYVPSTMSGLYNTVDDVIADYNAFTTGAIGVTFTRTTAPCSGGYCITVQESSLAGRCAQTASGTTTGGVVTSTTLTMTTGDGTILSWRDASTDPTALRRTMAHEIGHSLGLDHPNSQTGCSQSTDSVMLDAITSCNGAVSGYVPTARDFPPISDIYGAGVRQTCGF